MGKKRDFDEERPVRSEDMLARTYDKCFWDMVIKGGTALTVGALASLLFNRRAWPLVIACSFGVGVSYENCERDLNRAVFIKECPKKTKKKTAGVLTQQRK